MSKATPKNSKPIKEMEVVSDSDSDSNDETDSVVSETTIPEPEPKTPDEKAETTESSDDESEAESDDESDDESTTESKGKEDVESDEEEEEDTKPNVKQLKIKKSQSKKSKSKSKSQTFENFEYKDNIMTVDINDPDNRYHTTLINAIRRIIISELPNYSITYDNIDFHTNTSMLHNDMLAQRLCLLPLKYQTFVKYPDIEITYKKLNTSEDMLEIYNGDFEATSDGKPVPITEIFTSPEFLFSKLRPEQELSFTAKVGKSTPRQAGAHMMMTSTATYWFKHDTETLDKIMSTILDTDDKKTIRKKISDIYYSESIELMIDNIDEDEEKDVLRSLLEDLIYDKNSAGEPMTFTFKIKDMNAMKAPAIFKLAIDTLITKLNNLIEATKMNDTDKLEIFKSKTNVGSYQFDIGHEDFTLSYLIQHYFLEDTEYDYVGTIKPSPMKDMFILRTHTKSDNTKENNIEKFIHNLEKLVTRVEEFKSAISF